MSYTNQDTNLNSKKWDELVSYRRQLLKDLREATEKIIDLEKNGIHRLNEKIQYEKNIILDLSKRLAQIRAEITALNTKLLAISENTVKSKNFIVTMQPRLPSENEADLHKMFELNQSLIVNRQYKNERNKNEAISLMNDASMKLDAIKSIRIVNKQLEDLNIQAKEIKQKLNTLDIEKRPLESEYITCQNKLRNLFNDKKDLSEEHQSWLSKYDKYLVSLDAVNSRLDHISQKRRSNSGYRYNSETGALIKMKESAKRKFESGDKLSFDELKLLYGDG